VKNGDINIYMVYKNPVSNMMNSKTNTKKEPAAGRKTKKDPECLMPGEVFVAGDMIGKKTKLKVYPSMRGRKGASLCPGRWGGS